MANTLGYYDMAKVTDVKGPSCTIKEDDIRCKYLLIVHRFAKRYVCFIFCVGKLKGRHDIQTIDTQLKGLFVTLRIAKLCIECHYVESRY